MNLDTVVQIDDIKFGVPPVKLPAGQVKLLLKPGEFFVNANSESGALAGMTWENDGGITFHQGGKVFIKRVATHRIVGTGDSSAASAIMDAGGTSIGDSHSSDVPQDRLQEVGDETAADPLETLGTKDTIRTAQYICGILGLLMVNIILLYDASGRGSNVKDFFINFSSDISALGAVLIIAEWVDRTKNHFRRQKLLQKMSKATAATAVHSRSKSDAIASVGMLTKSERNEDV